MSKIDGTTKTRHVPGLIVLLLMGAFGVTGGALIAPALPALMQPFSVGEDRVGLVLSVYTMSAALSLPFIGFLLDRLGRKTVGIACLLLDGLFGVACVFAPSFRVLLLLRFFQGIGIAGLIPVAMTIIGDYYKERRLRLHLMGILSGTISGSAALIPLLGGALAGIDWRYPFFVYGVSGILAAAFLLFIPETRPDADLSQSLQREVRAYLDRLRRALAIKRVQETFAHSFLLYFLLYTLVAFLALYLVRQHGLSTFVAGLGLTVQASLAVVVASKASWIDQFLTWKQKLTTGFIIISLALGSVPLWGSPGGVAISLLAFGVGMGIIQPTVYHEATAAPPADLAGSVVALFNTMKYIGMSTSPFVLGYVSRLYSLGVAFTAAAVLSATWAILIVVGTGD